MTPEKLAAIRAAIPRMSLTEKAELLKLLEEQETRNKVKKARESALGFAHALYPGFKEGAHHRALSRLFQDIVNGTKKRIIINIAPRMGKSEFSSYLFPAYFLGHYPDKKIIMGTHTASLSADFGRKVKNLVDSPEYAAIFPDTRVSDDKKAADSWGTTEKGEYYAVGVGGSIAGRGADLFIIDDPHSEQDLKSGSNLPFETAWSWFQTGPLQRLMPGGAIIVIMTRWGKKDLTEQIIKHQIKNPGADQWEIVEFPAILNENTPQEKSLWPEQWPLEELHAKREGMDPRFWQAQYMQAPTSDIAAVIKREQWRCWEASKPPECEYVIQSWDTAHETKTSSDYSACTTWGVWFDTDAKYELEEKEEEVSFGGRMRTNRVKATPRRGVEDIPDAHIILLDAIKGRWTFPDLKKRALDYYKEWEPDACLIEKKAAGAPLIQELRAMGLAISEFSPSRAKLGQSNDKLVRLNAIADIFASGRVWAPETRWAREVMDEVASFPSGDHDDYVDCTVQALMRMRQGGFIRLPSDYEDTEPREFKSRKSYEFY